MERKSNRENYVSVTLLSILPGPIFHHSVNNSMIPSVIFTSNTFGLMLLITAVSSSHSKNAGLVRQLAGLHAFVCPIDRLQQELWF